MSYGTEFELRWLVMYTCGHKYGAPLHLKPSVFKERKRMHTFPLMNF